MIVLYDRGVGLLRYFQLKQLPNFLLASPILSLALCSLVHYAKSVPEKFFSLGFCASIKDENSAAVLFTPDVDLRSNLTQTRRKASSKIQGINFEHNLLFSSLFDIFLTLFFFVVS